MARKSDMAAGPQVFHGPYGTIALIVRRPSFFTADYYDVDANGGTHKIDVPEDAELAGRHRRPADLHAAERLDAERRQDHRRKAR